ncbi:hypothetical protein DCAR_0832350 [Daucus carota subsp. sativus]|uniref:Uncharacterized protein n=1 Tax=Daucus carota subsp. sativus TaxID=79200 RepID=A0A175YPU8_DAUCS|nr:hypothetical protein DCAR_0832350 [Daucus carota subsp. sativus]
MPVYYKTLSLKRINDLDRAIGGINSGAPDVTHIESSDSEHSFRDSNDESGEIDEESIDDIVDVGESIYPKVLAPK